MKYSLALVAFFIIIFSYKSIISRANNFQFIAINTLFFRKNSYKLIAIIKFVGFRIPILAALIIFSMKAYHIGTMDGNINPELVAPTYLSIEGTSALSKIISGDYKISDTCINNIKCTTINAVESEKLKNFNNNFYQEIKNSVTGVSYFKNNPFSLIEESAFRGRYVHHFNTLVFEFRQLREGQIIEPLISQYGILPAIPFFFINGNIYKIYPLASIASLILLTIIFLLSIRIDKNIFGIGLILLSISYTTSIAAITLSPGFSVFRYLSLAILLLLFYMSISGFYKFWIIPITVFFAITNSMQFNTILVCIFACVTTIEYLAKRPLIPAIKILFLVFLICLVQWTLYLNNSNIFEPRAFSSLGETFVDINYVILIFIFPLFSLYTKLCTHSHEKFSTQEIFAYTLFSALSSYAISFPYSPQHFSSFLLISSLGSFILLTAKNNKWWMIFILSLSLFLPAFFYKFYTAPFSINPKILDVYEYHAVGKNLKIFTPLDIDKISKEYDHLLFKHNVIGRVYFISKDKSYVELLNDKNILPSTYDVYTNFLGLNEEQLVMKLKAESASTYIVLESSEKRAYDYLFISKARGVLPSDEEQSQHLLILKKIEAFSKLISPYLVSCTERYCLYKLTSDGAKN